MCGGLVDIKVEPAPSFRDLFIRRLASQHPEYEQEVVLAEEFKDYFKEHAYADLLTFEDDIAQISSIIIIFLESPGSLVELGLFCSKQKYFNKLLIIAPHHEVENEDSFIYLGPLNHIRKHSDNSVLIYPFPSCDEGYSNIHVDDLIANFLEKKSGLKKTSAFNSDDSGHLALLICEIIRLSYPILITEIEYVMMSLDIDISRSVVSRLLYLMNKLGLVNHYDYGGNRYYYPAPGDEKYVRFGLDKMSKSVDDARFIVNLRKIYALEKDSSSRKRIAAAAEIKKKREI